MIPTAPVNTTQEVPSRLSLLDLPAEIRLLIYEYCEPESITLCMIHRRRVARWGLSAYRESDRRIIALLKTCRLIHTEASAVLYSRALVTVTFGTSLIKLQRANRHGSLSPFSMYNINPALVKHVEIYCEAREYNRKDRRVHLEDYLEAIMPALDWGRNLFSLVWQTRFYAHEVEDRGSPALLQTWRKIQFQGHVELHLADKGHYPTSRLRRCDDTGLEKRLRGESHESCGWCLTDQLMNSGGIEALR